MRDIWEGYGKSRVTEETGGSREDQRWGRRQGLLSFLALLAAVGCERFATVSDESSYWGSGYDYYGRNNYHRSPRRRNRYRRRRRW